MWNPAVHPDALQRQHGNESVGANAGNPRHALLDGHRFRSAVAESHVHSEDVLRAHPASARCRLRKRADQQSGARQQDEGERNLGDDQSRRERSAHRSGF